MQVCETNDFLVQRSAEQAQLEGVPLSELEKRMMFSRRAGMFLTVLLPQITDEENAIPQRLKPGAVRALCRS